jgi:hypothetical protein
VQPGAATAGDGLGVFDRDCDRKRVPLVEVTQLALTTRAATRDRSRICDQTEVIQKRNKRNVDRLGPPPCKVVQGAAIDAKNVASCSMDGNSTK